MTFYQIWSYTYSLVFVNKNVSLGFIKLLCTHDFSRVSLSTKLVYNVFVKDYDYIFVFLFVIIYVCIYIHTYIYICMFKKQSKFISQKLS